MKTLAYGICLVLAGVAPVAADNHVPRSLRMRSKDAPGAPRSAVRPAKRIAQAAPAPDQAPPGGDPAPAEASGAPGTEPGGAPAAEPGGAPAAEASGAPAAEASGAPAAEASGAEASGAPAEPAQPTPPAPEAPAATAQGEPALSDADLEKLAEQEAKEAATKGSEVITVTGSLIDRKEVDSPSPVSVVDREKLEAAGVSNVGDVLQKIPSQGNAINAQNNNGGDGSTRINLRSLGTARTLVLMNGRRMVASGLGADSSVDFGTIPLAIVERVEVLKDGASAIYGSDAIAGVVNVITRSDLNGTEADVYTTTTQQGDGTSYDLGFVTGHSSGRGNITFFAGYQQQKPVMAGDRDFGKQTYSYDFSCTPAREAAGECARRTLTGSPAGPTGKINALPGGGPPLSVPGCTPTADNPYCTADGRGGFRNYMPPTTTSFGDNYNFQPLNYLVTPSARVNLFSNGHYDLTRNAHVFFEGQFNGRTSTQQLAEEPASLGLFGTPIAKDSIYNPFGQDVIDYDRRLVEFGPRSIDQEVNTTRLVVGVNGAISETTPVIKNWKWEASYDYGRTDATQSTRGDLILSHLANALGPSFVDPAQGPRCGRPGSPIPGCVPLDLLTPGHVTRAMIDYLTFVGTQTGFNEQHTAQLTASGRLLELPHHGDVSLAVGADYRHEEGGQQPDPLTATGDTTGTAGEPTRGSYRTFEGFGELSVVPYAGGGAVKWVELNAAGRAYDYSTFGAGATGKLTGLVRTVGGLAVRGTYGNAFRAPNIAELYSGQADGFVLVEDPCDTRPPSATGAIQLDPMTAAQCARQGVPASAAFGSIQQRAQSGGNTELAPETATVGTAGVVYEPMKGLGLTLDYWRVQIDNAITTLPPSTILAQCYQGGIASFCDQIQRDPVTHEISHLIDIVQNVGSLTTSGLDFSAAYQYKNHLGTFRHAVEGTYLLKYNVDTGTIDPGTRREHVIHGRGFYDLGVNPDVKLNVFTRWLHASGLSAGLNLQFVSSFQECQADNCNDPSHGRREVSAYATGDLFAEYALKTSRGTTRITLGANNIADARPPVIYNGQALNADESAYNFLGRQFYLRLSHLF